MSKISDERLDSLEAIIHELAGDVAAGGPEDRAWAIINELRSGGEEKDGVGEGYRCSYCDGSGDVHRADGEWLGACPCKTESLSAIANTEPSLRAENERLRKARDEALAILEGVDVLGKKMVSALQAKLDEAVKVLEPFAKYMGETGDLDSKGQPLPDSEGVGWVYLTLGDFRAARSFLSNLKGAE